MGYERVSAKCTPAWMHFSGSDIALDSKNGFEGTSSQLLYLCTISIAVARGIWLPTKDSCRLRIHEDLTVGVDRDHFAMIGHFFTHTRSFLCIDMSEGIIFINHNLSIYTSEKIERCSWGIFPIFIQTNVPIIVLGNFSQKLEVTSSGGPWLATSRLFLKEKTRFFQIYVF